MNIFLGDYNDDDVVDGADYIVWRKTDGNSQDTIRGGCTLAKRSATARVPLEMPRFLNRQRWCC